MFMLVPIMKLSFSIRVIVLEPCIWSSTICIITFLHRIKEIVVVVVVVVIVIVVIIIIINV